MTTITETEPDTGHDRDLSPTLWRIGERTPIVEPMSPVIVRRSGWRTVDNTTSMPMNGCVLPPRMGACLLVLNEKVSGSLLFNSTLECFVRTAAGTR